MSRQEIINLNIQKKDLSNTKTDSTTNTYQYNQNQLQNLKQRRDAKGIPIIKKVYNNSNSRVVKSKHHAYFIDKLNPGKDLTDIVKIESYKEYNRDEEEEEGEEENNNNDANNNNNNGESNNSNSKSDTNDNNYGGIEQTNIQHTEGCCKIF